MAKSEKNGTPATGPDLEAAWRGFVDYLRLCRARITRSRQLVFEAALLRRDHFLADDLADQLSAAPRRVSRGTVYRTLALMVKGGFLRQLRDDDTHTHYEPLSGQERHEHMICDACGRFIEFNLPGLEQSLEKACRGLDFIPRTHRVAVFGLCRDCAAGR